MEIEGKASGGWGVPAAMSAEESQLSMPLMPLPGETMVSLPRVTPAPMEKSFTKML